MTVGLAPEASAGAVMPDPDVTRIARVFIKRYGTAAADRAMRKAADAAQASDMTGHVNWIAVAAAVEARGGRNRGPNRA